MKLSFLAPLFLIAGTAFAQQPAVPPSTAPAAHTQPPKYRTPPPRPSVTPAATTTTPADAAPTPRELQLELQIVQLRIQSEYAALEKLSEFKALLQDQATQQNLQQQLRVANELKK